MALNDLEAADEEELELDRYFKPKRGQIDDDSQRIFKPGERIFDLGTGERDGRFDGTMQGTPSDMVNIYDRTGRAMPMTRDLARVRLRKRYKPTHRYFPGERVFFIRPPREFPKPTIHCDGLDIDRNPCPKMFYTELQKRAHLRNRHESQWAERERERTLRNEDMALDLQRAQIAQGSAMVSILERLAAGDRVSADEAAAVVRAANETAPEPEAEPEKLFPDGIPDGEWKVTAIKAWLEEHGYEVPTNTFGWTREQWVELVERRLAGA